MLRNLNAVIQSTSVGNTFQNQSFGVKHVSVFPCSLRTGVVRRKIAVSSERLRDGPGDAFFRPLMTLLTGFTVAPDGEKLPVAFDDRLTA